MSITDPFITKAREQGADVDGPVDELGMTLALSDAAALGMIYYQPGMAGAWLASLQVYCIKARRNVYSYRELITAILLLSTEERDGKRFAQPYELWRAVGRYYRANVEKALRGRRQPDLPDEMQGADLETHREYVRRWRKIAARTGDSDAATAGARESFGLPAVPERSQIDVAANRASLQKLIENTRRKIDKHYRLR